MLSARQKARHLCGVRFGSQFPVGTVDSVVYGCDISLLGSSDDLLGALAMRTWQPVLLTLVVLGLADALVFGDPPKSGEATVQAPKAERADENPKVIAQPSDQPEEPKEITNSLGMRFVRIPKGTFLMGSPSDDERAEEDELQHQVTLSQDFYMSTLEVTQEQYV